MAEHVVHTQQRGMFAVEVIIGDDGKAHVVMAIPAEQIRLPRVEDLKPSDQRYTGDWNTDRYEWHRPCGISGEAACGASVGNDARFIEARAYKLDQMLCRKGCWSPHEIALGMAALGSRTGRHVKLVDPNKEKP